MDYKSCKDCDHRHPHCHSECPDYAEYKARLADIAKVKELERIGTSSRGKDKHCEAHQQHQIIRRNKKWCV